MRNGCGWDINWKRRQLVKRVNEDRRSRGGGDMHINGKNKHESHGLVEGTL